VPGDCASDRVTSRRERTFGLVPQTRQQRRAMAREAAHKLTAGHSRFELLAFPFGTGLAMVQYLWHPGPLTIVVGCIVILFSWGFTAWHSPWIEGAQWRRYTALAILFCGVAVFGARVYTQAKQTAQIATIREPIKFFWMTSDLHEIDPGQTGNLQGAWPAANVYIDNPSGNKLSTSAWYSSSIMNADDTDRGVDRMRADVRALG
jgi:hypothetical protein